MPPWPEDVAALLTKKKSDHRSQVHVARTLMRLLGTYYCLYETYVLCTLYSILRAEDLDIRPPLHHLIPRLRTRPASERPRVHLHDDIVSCTSILRPR